VQYLWLTIEYEKIAISRDQELISLEKTIQCFVLVRDKKKWGRVIGKECMEGISRRY